MNDNSIWSSIFFRNQCSHLLWISSLCLTASAQQLPALLDYPPPPIIVPFDYTSLRTTAELQSKLRSSYFGEDSWLLDTELNVSFASSESQIQPLETTSDGTGGSGNGQILVTPYAGQSGLITGFVQIAIQPELAIQLGASWKIQDVHEDFVEDVDTIIIISDLDSFTIEFKPISGFDSPSYQTIAVVADELTTIEVNYKVVPPELRLDFNGDLMIRGTANTSYRIESCTVLKPIIWDEVTEVTINTNQMWQLIGNVALLSTPAQFYRAVWLP